MKLLVKMKPICDQITIVPRLISEHLLQNENKHQIMNLHTKRNCLIPILSSLLKYQLFQACRIEIVREKELIRISGKITTVPRLL